MNVVFWSRQEGHMRKGEKMRPVVFKGGKAWGKVEGIRGLFRDPSGRWFVRKSIGGIDKQKTLDFGGKTPCFSTLERMAERELKVLTREIQAELGTMEPQTAKASEKRAHLTPLQRGQEACARWVRETYTQPTYARDTVSRRIREADGFAFVTRDILAHAEEINDHNKSLAAAKFAAYVERGSEVASVDCLRIIKAIFTTATDEGKHMGLNPAATLCKRHSKRKDRPDERFISMEQSAELQAALPVWCRDHGIAKELADEMALFFYLLTLGMRPSSAILFTSDDLTVADGVYRYRVNNNKADTFMPVSQIIHPDFGKKLKALPVYDKGRKKSSFRYTEDFILDKLNDLIAEKLGDPRVKSLRKGFITETMAAAREPSTDFDSLDARRLTHILKDTADNNYNCSKQEGSDRVMKWWNKNWFAHYKAYAALPENRLKPSETEDPIMHRRAMMEDLSDILD